MQAKALYNLLRYNWQVKPDLNVEFWQVENLRNVSAEELFNRLETLDIPLNQERFFCYAETVSTPEELAECLWVKEDKDLSGFDQAYLLLFELWRRFLPDKQSISLFCDELDYRIALYDEGQLPSEELLNESLEELEDIVDENVDHGEDPQEVFALISTYCAHDIESFLYDYIVEQIDAGNEMYASELLEGFYEYVSDPRWFQFLRVVLFYSASPQEGELMLRRLLDQLQEDPNFDLLVEIANYLVHQGDVSLFMQTLRQASHLIEKEKQFQELLEIMVKFYQCCDKEKEYHTFQTLSVNRKKNNPESPFDKEDKDYFLFKAQLS